jgi:hypothetical protein
MAASVVSDHGSSGVGGSRPDRARQGCRSGLEAVELVHQRFELVQPLGDLSALLVKEVGHGHVLVRLWERPAYIREAAGSRDRCLSTARRLALFKGRR